MSYFTLKKETLKPFFPQTAKMTVTVHRWFLLSRGKAEESSQIVSPNLVTWCGGFLQRAHAPRDTRSTKKVCCEEIESTLNTSLSQKSLSWQETEFISSARFPKFLFVYFVFLCNFGKVILMSNIQNDPYDVCIPLPLTVHVSTNVWPLTWLDRLIHFPGAAWKFYPDLWLVWSAVLLSAMVRVVLGGREPWCCDEERENRGPGWHGGAGGRVNQDCLQMLFRGPSAYLTKGCGT